MPMRIVELVRSQFSDEEGENGIGNLRLSAEGARRDRGVASDGRRDDGAARCGNRVASPLVPAQAAQLIKIDVAAAQHTDDLRTLRVGDEAIQQCSNR